MILDAKLRKPIEKIWNLKFLPWPGVLTDKRLIMKFSALLALLFLFFFPILPTTSQDNISIRSRLLMMGWREPEIDSANTAAEAKFLQPEEREVILITNLVRLYPQIFLQRVLISGFTENISYEDNSYYRSLIKDLQSQKPLPALQPDETLTRLARDYAISSGKKGFIGHGDFDRRMKKIQCMGWKGENINYGANDPLDIVVQLLIDNNVPSLGHRKNLLDASYRFIGVGMAPHKSEYRTVCVMDFSSCR